MKTRFLKPQYTLASCYRNRCSNSKKVQKVRDDKAICNGKLPIVLSYCKSHCVLCPCNNTQIVCSIFQLRNITAAWSSFMTKNHDVNDAVSSRCLVEAYGFWSSIMLWGWNIPQMICILSQRNDSLSDIQKLKAITACTAPAGNLLVQLGCDVDIALRTLNFYTVTATVTITAR